MVVFKEIGPMLLCLSGQRVQMVQIHKHNDLQTLLVEGRNHVHEIGLRCGADIRFQMTSPIATVVYFLVSTRAIEGCVLKLLACCGKNARRDTITKDQVSNTGKQQHNLEMSETAIGLLVLE